MQLSVGIFIFPDVEVLDFAGPYEVFTTASRVFQRGQPDAGAPYRVFTVAADAGLVRARAGLQTVADFSFADCPPVDVLVIPGGVVTAALNAPDVIAWIGRRAQQASLVASVCTGSFLLAGAGLLQGRQATTHWEDIADLRAQFPAVHVLEGRRWVDEGTVVTSAGISAGIDMSLHLVARTAGAELAAKTARQMDFDWRRDG